VPAAEFIEAIAAVIRSGQIEILLSKMPGDIESNRQALLGFRDSFLKNPEKQLAEWAKLASDLRAEYRSTAKRKLDTLTKLTLIGTVQSNQSEVLNLLLD